MDSTTRTQKFFLEHTDDIICLDIFDNLVVTGQMGLSPPLIVWDINTMRMKVIYIFKKFYNKLIPISVCGSILQMV